MNDTYAEWLVRRKAPGYTYVVKALMIVLCVVGVLASMMFTFGILVLAAAAAATYFVFINSNLEFEYLVVNDQITIDKIMGQSRRKKAWESSLETIQIIAPADSYLLKDHEREGAKVLDFSSHVPGARVYAIVDQKGETTTKILFEPNEKILDCLWQKGPRKVIK